MKHNLLKSVILSVILLMGVSNAWGKIIYLCTSDINWAADNAVLFVWSWQDNDSGVATKMTSATTNLYKADIEDNHNKIIFMRMKNSSTEISWDNNLWNRTQGDQAIDDNTPCFKLTAWGSYGSNECSGTWGKISYDTHIYLDNSVANWSEATKEFMIGHSSYSDTYTMTQISNTKLYYLAFSDIWHGYWDYGFIGVTSHWGPYENQDITTRIKSADKRTGTRGDQVLNGTKLFVPADANNDAVLTKTDLSGHSALNYTQTIKSAVKLAGKNYEEANSKATITVTSYNLTGNGTISTQQTTSINTSAKSTTISAARTATTKLSVGTVATGYQFDGWYTAATDGTRLSTSTTYTYYPTEAKTVYARFSEITYSVQVKSADNNQGTVSPTPVNAGQFTGVAITATPQAGYSFVNWTATTGITIANANSASTTITATKAGTVTANFKELPANTIYFKPNDNWKQNNARFEALAMNNGTSTSEWIILDAVGCGDYYTYDVPAKYNKILFARMNPAKGGKSFDYGNGVIWNQTEDLDIQKNKCFELGDGQWGDANLKATGTWAAYNPTVTLTLKSSSNGTYKITYEGKTYESSLTEDVVINDLPLDAKIIISESATPNAGYWLKERFIKLGTNEKVEATTNTPYTLCGNTTISANFVTIQSHTVYLNITDHNWASDNAKLAIYVYDEADGEGEGTWIALTQVGSSKYYTATIPKNESNFNFVRLKNSTLNWNNKWNQTGNLAIPVTRYNTFSLTSFGSDGIDAEGKWGVGTAYSGDYKLAYVEQVVAKGEGADNWKTVINNTAPSHTPDDIIRKRANGRDTISLFINIDGDNPEVILQQYDGSKWVDIEAHMVNGPLEADASMAMLPGRKNASPDSNIDDFVYDDGIDAITESGVWNFVIVQDAEGNASLLLKENDQDVTHKYTGNYYIRTNNAAGGWNTYTHPDNIMSRSTYSESGYTHYYCKWVDITNSNITTKPENVKYIVATDYSINVSKEFAKDDYTTDGGVLVENANVRWSWDENTGVVARAYIQGAYNGKAQNENILLDYTTDGETDATDVILSDNGDWIYTTDITVQSGATLKTLTATYPSKDISGITPITQTFAADKEMLTGMSDQSYTVRVLYDFKENETMIWLLPTEGATTAIDVLIERVNHDEATQVAAAGVTAATAENEGETGFTIYAAISFERDFVNDVTKSKDLRQFYWVSFPFNVDMKDVFGFGEYGTHWILEYYDGERRAQDGLWLDSPSFWEYIIDTTDFVIEANKGYVLCLDLETMGTKSEVFQNTDKVTLYFPSKEKLTTIDQEYTITEVDIPPHIRTNPRANRHIYDSNWNLIGVPSYANKDFTSYPTNLQYFYEYNPQDKPNQSDYTTKSSENANFKSMYAYFVQWGGRIEWTQLALGATPQEMQAKKNANYETKKHNLRLELQHNAAYTDQTFVALQEEGATAAFDLNLDLTKISGTCSGIYTLAGEENIQLAGNVLPLEDNTIIPVGVQIATAGEYTFAMPDGTDGIVVELIDYETNTTTNLMLDEYTVNLGKGTFESRFALHVKPDKTVTSVEDINTNSDGVRKFIIDGTLYMQKDGMLYDAQGRCVQ